jgi:hypothetical protein
MVAQGPSSQNSGARGQAVHEFKNIARFFLKKTKV